MFVAPQSIWEKGPLMATHMGTFCSDNFKPPIKAQYSALMLPKTPRGGALSGRVGTSGKSSNFKGCPP